MNLQTSNEPLNATTNLIEKVPEIYKDAIQPTLKEFGKTVSLIPKAINAALSPLQKWIMYKEYNLEETKLLLSEKLKNINPKNIVSPEPYVAVPAMQAISYSYNSKELRNMYATLLANSMNKDTQDTVHPAFVELIKQLSPLEAQILKKLYDNIEYTISYPLVKLRSTISEVDNTGIDRIEHILNSDFGVNIFNIDKYILAIDNLYRLNLISVTYISRFSDISKYESIESSDLFHDIKQKCNNMPNLNFLQVIRGKFDITSLGIAFISACVS